MLSSTTFFVLLPFIAGIHAINDWTVPCTTGSCSYDLPRNNEAVSSGSLKIWGGVDAITDITNAADWEILDCDPTALAQDIRLVCKTDPDDPNSKCGHLYQNIGAVNKIVRLPENCGANAFARIAKAWVPDDQSIPEAVQKRLVRRTGVPPVVKALHIDTNFDAVQWSQTGMVNIALQGVNVPGLDMSVTNTGSQARRVSRRGSGRGVTARGLFGKIKDGLSKAGDAIKDGAEAVGGAVTTAADDTADAAKAAAQAVSDEAKKAADDAAAAAKSVADEAKKVADEVKNKTSVDLNKSSDKSISFDKSFNLLHDDISCGADTLSLNVDMAASADMQATVSLIALGTVIPPELSKFSVAALMNGHIGGSLDITADITGSLTSGPKTVFEVGIPGFDFPGIFKLGPSFSVLAQIGGQVDIHMDMVLGVTMDLTNTTMSFPPDSGNNSSGNSVSLGDSPLTLNAAPNIQATGVITATLTPKLSFGISALGGKGQAEVFFEFPVTGELTLDLDSSGEVVKNKNGGAAEAGASADPTPAPLSFGGCVNVAANVNINFGADGNFFGLFSKVVSQVLFNKDFQIFRKCFGDQANSTTSATDTTANATTSTNDTTANTTTSRRSLPDTTSFERRIGFTCPIGSSAKSGITSGTIAAQNIQPS
ncbi:hypothetical protein C8F01DRAFT_1069029 [Mycena amicta]|nr:hypothetical protein C8F01DRAFT_1069029 [Mycena amicta]